MAAPYMLVQTDLSKGVPTEIEGAVSAKTMNKAVDVRRPLVGFQIKDDTYASLTVFGDTDVIISNSSAEPGKYQNSTSNFILQSVTEQRQEKFQPVTTFGGTYGFFFGEHPRMMQYSAVLLNTADFQWEIEWWYNYENYLRGTKLVDKQVKAYLAYDDVVIEGYLTSASTSKNAMTPWQVQLTFTMWVTGIDYIVDPGSPYFNLFPEVFGSLDYEVLNDAIESIRDVVGDPVSSTQEVLARNKTALASTDLGLVSTIREGLSGYQDFTGQVGAKIQQITNLLYGRNIVIPAGAEGSDLIAGRKVTGVVTVRVPRRATGFGESFAYWHNYHEYVRRSAERGWSYEPSADTIANKQKQEPWYSTQARKAFGDAGISLSLSDGAALSDATRLAGQLGFAAINLTAMYATKDPGTMTVGDLVGEGKIRSFEKEYGIQVTSDRSGPDAVYSANYNPVV